MKGESDLHREDYGMSEKKPSELAMIKDLMNEMLDKHGATPPGVGWRDERTMELRFDQLLKLFEDEKEKFTLNDLGCGLASLYRHIKKRGIAVSKYYGYDMSDKMLNKAREAVPAGDGELICADHLTHLADYSVASGIFNTRLEADEAEWKQYMKSVIRDLDAHSSKGFAFNSLTSYVDWKQYNLFYVDPCEIFDFCKREFSRKVTLLHDYDLWEWTIIVRK